MSKFKVVKPFFKTHKKNGHPSYIYAENSEEYKYIGITHSSKTHCLKNKRLKYNPNPLDSRSSYIRSFSTRDKKDNFRMNIKKGYKIHKADKKMIRQVKRNHRY